MTSTIKGILAALLVSFLGLLGCAESLMDPTYTDETGKPDEQPTSGGKEDRWDWQNDPSRFEGQLIYELSRLPRSGRAARIAWPSSYWPTYEDSINVRWNATTELSPAEKYDRAFNGWTPSATFSSLRPFHPDRCGNSSNWDRDYYNQLGPLARHVSQNMGNLRSRDGIDSDGDGQTDECDDNDGVETWWGLCHAWVPAAILEDSPQRAVTYNGITFHPSDLEALLIAAYNRSSASMIGGRCNLGNGEDSRVERDEHGRVVNTVCRDTNAGSFHVIMANYLGVMQRAYAEDRTYDYQVWNQPVVAYEVTRLDEITVARANELLSVTGNTYTFNPDAAKLYYVEANTTYITESYPSTSPANPGSHERRDYYTYILEVDGAGKIIGGEWTGNSRTNHPDFLWNPIRLTQSSVSNLDLENIRMLIRMSREPATTPTGGDVVTFNGQGSINIPDNNSTGVTSSLNVGQSLTISSLQVAVDITHTYIGDLRVTLSHNGTERVLHNNEGGSADNIQRTINVTGFEGTNAQGQWTLKVVDNAGQDVGTLRGWRLLVTTGSGSGSGGTSSGSNTVTFNGPGNINIPDNNSTGATSTLNVGQSLTVGSLQVALDITHTYIGDLKVSLSHNGRNIVLHNNEGGAADNIQRTVNVTGFEGMNAQGQWTLKVVDSAASDTGSIRSWRLLVTTGNGSSSGGSTGGSETFPGNGGIAIPDNNSTGITSEAVVPNDVTQGAVQVAVNITHTYIGDLVVTLTHGSQSWTLHNRSGGGTDNINQTYPVSNLTGSPAGVWRIKVVDAAGADVGTLQSWSVTVGQ